MTVVTIAATATLGPVAGAVVSTALNVVKDGMECKIHSWGDLGHSI